MSKSTFKKYMAFAIGMLLCSPIFSQTTTFDYVANTFSTTACNIFSPQLVKVNNIVHESRAGGVQYSASAGKGLLLATATNKGTAFVIDYTFQANRTYVITMKAKGDSAVLLNYCVVPNLAQFTTPSTSACGTEAAVSNYSLVGLGRRNGTPSSSGGEYSQRFTVPAGADYPYLVVFAQFTAPGLSVDAGTISSISIADVTPVATSFALTPTTVSKTCGSSTSVPFSVMPTGVPSGATVSYTWNLGANNNWIYNSAPAPATINTNTATSLTLTYDACTPAPGSVSVTAAVTSGGTTTNYNTNTVTPGLAPFVINSSDNSTFCSGTRSYFINNSLSCTNASVAWSLTDPNSAVSGPSCTSCYTTNLTKTGSGTVTLNATVSNACGVASTPLSKSIVVGFTYPQLNGTYTTSNGQKTLQTVNSGLPISNVNVSYTWPGVTNINAAPQGSYSPPINFSSSAGAFSFSLASQQQVSIYITGTYTCGAVDATRSFIQGGSSWKIAASPNPARDYIVLKLTAATGVAVKTDNAAAGNTKVYLYDSRNAVLVQQWSFPEVKSDSYNLRLNNLKPGTYELRVERNKESATTKIVIGQN